MPVAPEWHHAEFPVLGGSCTVSYRRSGPRRITFRGEQRYGAALAIPFSGGIELGVQVNIPEGLLPNNVVAAIVALLQPAGQPQPAPSAPPKGKRAR